MIKPLHSIPLITLICLAFQLNISGQQKMPPVNLFIGTSGDNGQVDPAACVPYGMARVCPDMVHRSHSGYDFAQKNISGFSVNRLSGIGCGGNGGNLSIKPADKNALLSLVKSTEISEPGYYSVKLDNGVTAALTATTNVAVEQYLYPAGTEQQLLINFASSFTGVREVSYNVISDSEISGYLRAGTTCDAGTYKLFFNIRSDRSFRCLNTTGKVLELSFGKASGKPVEMRVALSPVNVETATAENNRIAGIGFNAIRKEAMNNWCALLNKIEVKGGTTDDRILFYTSLYRVFLSPANVTSSDRRYLATDGSINTARDFTYYSSWSMWDNYRTKFPLITLLEPGKMRDISRSLAEQYIHGKKDWATDFESGPTVRTEHSICVLLDAYRKGITGLNLDIAYEAIKKEVDSLRFGRPDQAMETCIDLWAMSEIARETNHTGDAIYYKNKAQQLFTTTWEKEFCHVNSSYALMRNNGLYQGSRWQYRWAVPQYLPLMENMSGGRDTLANQLDYFFEKSMNNQGNEVGIHAPFIFNRLGRPQEAQTIVKRMLTEQTKHLYGGNAEYPEPVVSRIFKNSPVGFLPEMDEDDGTMCGWYVFASMGLFPLVVGEPSYEITSPIYDEIRIQLDKTHQFMIVARNRKSLNDIIKKVKFNGIDLPDFRINHNMLTKGGVLELFY